jgi:L-ascorbate metabolism protein UlaG (beta-lactamase superfamily)
MASTRARRILTPLGALFGLGVLLALADVDRPALGGTPDDARLARMRASPQYDAEDGVFRNPWPTFSMGMSGRAGTLFREYLSRTGARPQDPLPVEVPDFRTPPPDGFRVTWLGHSTLLVEIDGATFLTDPQWSERASPFRHLGPRRFSPPPVPLEALPRLDAVVISHDHYDHLDAATVRALASRVPVWHVPLGIGAHLARWGVPADRVVEHDWWDGSVLPGTQVTLTAVPSQHFSGRSLTDRFRTLWASWTMTGPRHRFFFSGDTGYHDDFDTIAARMGPFDLVALEAGAWNAAWGGVHLGPEGLLRAARDLGAAPVLPIHWATFDLATHPWRWPAEEVTRRAADDGLVIAEPRLGGSVTLASLVADGVPTTGAAATPPPARTVRPRDPEQRWWEQVR